MVAEPGPHAWAGPEAELAEVAAAVGKSARRRKLRTGFLVSVFTVATLTAGAEAFLRLTHERERSLERNVTTTNRRWVALTQAGIFEEIGDPVRRYALRANRSCTVDGWVFRVSSHRTRGPDFSLAKPAGEKRLLCLGDSFAFGLWCDEQETLVARLAERANEREAELGSSVRWRGVNLGVPGYHLGQTLRAFEQDGLALDPDVVVLYFNTNDIERDGFFFDQRLGVLRRDFLPLPVRLRRFLWRWSHLYGWIAARHARAVERVSAPFLDERVPYAHVRADNQAYARDALLRIAVLCRARGLPLFLVNQPLVTFLGDTRRADWQVVPLVQWAENVRRELCLPGIDLLGWIRGYGDGVDRMAGLAALESAPPPDFIPDLYFADERVQDAVRWAREKTQSTGRAWEELSFEEQKACFAGYPGALPTEPDFHFTGEGYGHIARLVYERMRAEELLP